MPQNIQFYRVKFRILLAAVALYAAIVGGRRLIEYSRESSVRWVAVQISKELAWKMMSPSGGDFDLTKTSFLDSYARETFYVLLEFKDRGTRDKLQEVFFFEAFGGKPRVKWSYSVLNNLAKLRVGEGAFCCDERSCIQRKGQGFEMSITLSPVEWNIQGETISRLREQGVEMLVSLEGHPELNPFRIANVTGFGNYLAEFSSKDDALACARIFGIKPSPR